MRRVVRHFASPSFWQHYRCLPGNIRKLADKNFALLKSDLRHSSLRLKKAGGFWSARVGLGHRALGRDRAEGIVGFWIGTHAEYDELLK